MSEWQNLETELRHFQRLNNLDGRYDIRRQPDFKWFLVTLCREPGTLLQLIGSPTDNRINVSIFQSQGQENWHQLFETLKVQIEKKWPAEMSGQERSTSIKATL